MFEPEEVGNRYRKEYIDSIEEVLRLLSEDAAKRRTEYFQQNFPGNAEAVRSRLKEKLGWPLTQPRREIISMQKEYCGMLDGYGIYRIQYGLLHGIKFYGMLFLREDGTKRPLVIAQHGGLGTPEGIGGLYGSTGNYNDMVRRLLDLGANVFAPQLLIWDPQHYSVREQDAGGDVNEMRRPLDSMLQQVGSSMTAIEIHCIQCAVDHLTQESFSAPGHLGMAGLSYGGFYALYMAAVDTRINCALSSCFFNGRGPGLRAASNFIWGDSGNWFEDAEAALLVYPRRLRIQVAKRDQLLPFEGALKEYERFESLARELTGDDSWYLFDAFDGRHEFSPDDECLRWLMERC